MKTRYRSIIYDFDGVILDTVAAKVDAFAQVYRDEDPSRISEIRAYAEANGGMSRYEKFRYFESALFGRPLSEGRLEELCAQYRTAVETAVASARFIDGALETIVGLHGIVSQHVVSAAPEDELRSALTERGLLGRFKSIGGAPRSKRAEFRRILSEDGVEAGAVLAIGDSLMEYHAAVELGMPFLAIIAHGVPDRFPAGVSKTTDLSDLILFINNESDRREAAYG